MDVSALIVRRHRQLLVHSFLYYRLNEVIIEDTTFDRWCDEAVGLHRDHVDEAKKSPYWSICRGFDGSGSGFWIRDYPPEIVSTAMRLLYEARGRSEAFQTFLARYGMGVIVPDD